jgi:uncharacterized RDD family membrane protein YckC
MTPAPGYSGATTFVYASFLIRFVAAFIDGLIVSVALFVIFFIIGIIAGIAAAASGSEPPSTMTGGAALLADVIYFVLYSGYFVYFWGMGQTPGMRIFRIYVADPMTGGPIGFSRAMIRFLGYLLSTLACYVGLIWAAFDPRRQGWHDKFAGSIVIQL